MAWVSRLPDFALSNSEIGSWETDHWLFPPTYIDLTAIGQTWADGYRPTQIKIVVDIATTDATFDAIPYIGTEDYTFVVPIDNYAAVSGINEFVWGLDWGAGTSDFAYLYLETNSPNVASFSVTEIAFNESATAPYGVAEIGVECAAVGVALSTPSSCVIEFECLAHGVALRTHFAEGAADIGFELTAHIVRHGIGAAVLDTVLAAPGSAIPPTLSKEVLNTRYLLTLQGSKTFTVDRTAAWVATAPSQWVTEGDYWATPLSMAAINLSVSGNWATGFRPATISVDFDLFRFQTENGDLPPGATFVFSLNLVSGLTILANCNSAELSVTSRQTLTFALPTLTADMTGVVFWFFGGGFPWRDFSLQVHGIVYTYVGIGEEEYLPMSNFSVSSRSGSPSNINATVPYTPQAMDTATGYDNAILRLYREQTYSDGDIDTSLVESGDLTHMQLNQGSSNASIVLTAQATSTNTAPKYVVLQGVSYYAAVDGKQRVRCSPFNGLNVGDTVKAGGHTLIANNIQLSVSVTQELMEIYE